MAEPREGLGAGVPRLPVELDELAEHLKPLGSERRLRILQYLVRPHYLEEIASYLGVARQTAQRHVDQLLEVGAIRKVPGQRESGPVVEYVVIPQRLFAMGEDLLQLGRLRPELQEEALEATAHASTVTPSGRAEMGPSLVVVHGLEPGTVHRLVHGQGPWMVGRGEGREIRLDHDPFVSNKHASIEAVDEGHVIADAYSTNGTYVNWQALEPGEPQSLEPGDVLTLGKSRLVYWG